MEIGPGTINHIFMFRRQATGSNRDTIRHMSVVIGNQLQKVNHGLRAIGRKKTTEETIRGDRLNSDPLIKLKDHPF